MYKEIIKNPSVLLPKKHILLISHMRANTTLLGHIFGTHPDISGYYEHHIGYYSWKSLIRKKIKFLNENPKEPITKYYFDKVLHNEHYINQEIINKKNVSLIFMLRKPERTIKSIVSLYRKNEPDNDFCSVDFACNYYINRMNKIIDIAENHAHKKNIFYLDAEAILKDTETTLEKISNWHELNPALTENYKLFKLSGKKKYGDSSEKINHGYISKSTKSYDSIMIDKILLQKSKDAYKKSKEKLINLAKASVVLSINNS